MNYRSSENREQNMLKTFFYVSMVTEDLVFTSNQKAVNKIN